MYLYVTTIFKPKGSIYNKDGHSYKFFYYKYYGGFLVISAINQAHDYLRNLERSNTTVSATIKRSYYGNNMVKLCYIIYD